MAQVPAQYVPIIQGAANRYGISASLLAAQINQESGFNPNAVSPAGALGISQFIPSTAAQYGVNTSSVTSSIYGQAHYMADNLAANNGDVARALAAYNAGQGAVNKYGGIPPYPQTIAYVNAILSSQSNYAALDQQPGSAVSPFEQVSNVATTITTNIGAAANAIGAVTNPAAYLGGAIGSANNPLAYVANLLSNMGPLLVGIGLFALGAFMLTFAWGEDISRSVDKIATKLAPIVEAG